MNGAYDLDELRALFAAKLDGTIGAEDHAGLERILAQHPEARQLWFLHCDLETGLADWAAGRSTPDAVKVITPPPSVFRLLAPLAAAAAIAVGFFWWSRPARLAETPAKGVAVLARAVGVEWEGATLNPGAVLPPGTLRLRSGAALVEFYSGARVVLEGPAELRLVGAGEAFLQAGKLCAHVPPQARGFTVGSPGVKVVDHGTEFGFEVKEGAAPEVHVFTGNVEVIAASRPPLALREGEAVRIVGETAARIPAERAAYLTEAELADRDSARARARLEAWRTASVALAMESAAVIHYTFEEADAVERRIANRTVNAVPETHGSIVGCTWTDGRWRGKRALEFRGEGDRVRFLSPQPMSAVTLLAWVRVSALPRRENVLLAADSEQTGALHWQLTQAGELRLEIARDLGHPRADWEAVNSAPFVTSDQFGQWLLLATTFDGGTIRHYGNGQEIGHGASFTPPALHLGAAELANWRGGTQRQLAGALDEFAVLARAMSAQEVRELYEAGRP